MPDEEEGIQTLILTRSLHRRFIDEQKEIIRKLIRDFSPEREVFYTFFDTPKIVHEDALEDILEFKEVIYKIIFDQRGTDFLFYLEPTQRNFYTSLRGARRYTGRPTSIRLGWQQDS